MAQPQRPVKQKNLQQGLEETDKSTNQLVEAVVQNLFELIAAAFGVNAKNVTIDSSAKDFPKWDSLRTVLLASSLEQAYRVTFQPDEVHSLTSVARIREALIGHGVNIDD